MDHDINVWKTASCYFPGPNNNNNNNERSLIRI